MLTVVSLKILALARFEHAKVFYLKGAKVIMACRSQERADAAKAQIEASSPAPGENVGSVEVCK